MLLNDVFLLCVFYADAASTLGAIHCVFGFAHFQMAKTHRNTTISRVARAKSQKTASGRMAWRTFNFRWPFGEHVFLFHLLTVRTELCAAKVCL